MEPSVQIAGGTSTVYPGVTRTEEETKLVKDTFHKIREAVKDMMDQSGSFFKSFHYLNIASKAMRQIRAFQAEPIPLNEKEMVLLRRVKAELKSKQEWNEGDFFRRVFTVIAVALATLCLVQVLTSTITTLGLLALGAYACMYGVPPSLLEAGHKVVAWLNEKKEDPILQKLFQQVQEHCATYESALEAR